MLVFIINSQDKQMYTDFQFYNPLMPTQMFVRPLQINSMQLFQIFSVALDSNINSYFANKSQQALQIQPNQPRLMTGSQIAQVVEIESENCLLENNKISQNFRQVQQNNLKNSTPPELQQTFLESTSKPQMIHSEEENICLPAQNLKCEAYNSFDQFTKFEGKRAQIWEDFVQFTIKVPQLGICNSELLKRKENLLRRKIGDWSELGKQAKKRRRYCRMLNN